MPGFRMEKIVNKGLTDSEILTAMGFINIAEEQDGRKTAVKDRRVYGGIVVSTQDEGEQVKATVEYSSIQNPLHKDPPAKVDPKKK